MNCPSYNIFFETVSSKIRIRILELLRVRPRSVTEISTSLGEEQSNISHNLKKMSDCHIIDVKRDGKKRIYSLNKETMLPLLQIVEKHVKKYCLNECKRVTG